MADRPDATQTVLVPLDGSELAARALKPAARLIRATGGTLVIVRARPEVHPEHLGHAESVRLVKTRDSVLAREAEQELATVASTLGAQGIATTSLLGVGQPAAVILAAARNHDADLIVMSTHGRGGLGGHWSYGSVADSVLRRASVPVLLVPAIATREWVFDRELRLLITLDGSAFAEEALSPAVGLGRRLNAQMHLLRVVDPATAGDLDAATGDAERYLDDIATRLGETSGTITTHVATGSPAAAITDAARQLNVGAVAMATHGRGGLSRLVMGSTATATLQHIEVPLLLVRPGEIRNMPAPPDDSAEDAGPYLARSVTIAVSAEELATLRHLLERAPARTGEVAGSPAVIENLLHKIAAAEAARGKRHSTD